MMRTVFARKSILWIMAFLAGGTLIFSGLPQMVRSLFNSGNSLGTVNGLPIFLYEYRAEFVKEQRVLAAYREQFGNSYKKILSYLGKSDNAEQSAQEQLISNKLLLSMARQIPVYLHTAYITRELAQPRTIYGILGEGIPAHYLFNEQGILKLDMLHRFLRQQGLTMEQFEGLAEQLLQSQWALKLAYGANIVSKSGQALSDRRKFYSRTFTLETLDLEGFMKREQAQSLSNEEITSFYEKNSASSAYWSPERRSGTLWTFDLSRFSPESSTESDAPKTENKAPTVEDQRRHFLGVAQQLLLLGDEKAFSQFVEHYHAQVGSVVKVMLSKENPDTVSSLLFSGGKIGEKSVGSKGSKGYIVEVTNIIAPQRLPFEVVKEKVIEDIYRSRAQAHALQALQSPTPTFEHKQTSTFKIAPQASVAPDVLTKLGLTLDLVNGLIMPHASKEGTSDRYAYRVTLTASEPDEKVRDDLGSPEVRSKKLYEATGELMLRNLIASLRSHAIILIRTEPEII